MLDKCKIEPESHSLNTNGTKTQNNVGCSIIWNPPKNIQMEIIYTYLTPREELTTSMSQVQTFHKVLIKSEVAQNFWLKSKFWLENMLGPIGALWYIKVTTNHGMFELISWFGMIFIFFMIMISFFLFVAHKFMNTARELALMWAFLFCSEFVYVYIYNYNVYYIYTSYIYRYIWEAL